MTAAREKLGAEEAQYLLLRQRDGEHGPRGESLEESAALGDESQGVRKREHAGQAGGCVLADAVAEEGGGLDSPGPPLLRQGVLDDEESRLGEGGLRQPRRRGVEVAGIARRPERLPKVETQEREKDLAAAVHLLVKDRLAAVKFVPHAHPLRPLTGEEKDDVGTAAGAPAGREGRSQEPGRKCQVEVAQGPPGLEHGMGEEILQVALPALDRGAVEERSIPLAVEAQAPLRLGDVPEELELRPAGRDLQGSEVEPRNRQLPRGALEVEQGGNERRAAAVGSEVQPADQTPEGVEPVLVGVEELCPHGGGYIGEAAAGRGAGPQRQEAQEVAAERRSVRGARVRRDADDQVVLAGQAVEKRPDRGEEQDRQGAAQPRREQPEGGRQIGIDSGQERAASEAPLRPSRPVDRQLKRRWWRGEASEPEGLVGCPLRAALPRQDLGHEGAVGPLGGQDAGLA